MNKGSTAISH
jgi:hypothetical protein